MPIILTTFLALIFTVTSAPASQATHSEVLVETGWLAVHLNDTNLRIVDVRSPEKYRAGHIHNAVSGPMEEVAITPDLKKAVTHELPPKQKIEAWAGSLGIGNATTVILYDEGNSNWATRVFWTLEYYGHSGKVSILNGGFNKWKSEGRETTGDVPKVKRVGFNTSVDESRLATKEYLLQNLRTPAIVVLDVRSPKEYTGEDRRAARGGHIPGAVNVEWTNNLLPDIGLLKSPNTLRQLYEASGVTKDKEIIVYCQSGMRASHTYFTLRLLGYPRVRVYDGSWQEWGNDPTVPVD